MKHSLAPISNCFTRCTKCSIEFYVPEVFPDPSKIDLNSIDGCEVQDPFYRFRFVVEIEGLESSLVSSIKDVGDKNVEIKMVFVKGHSYEPKAKSGVIKMISQDGKVEAKYKMTFKDYEMFFFDLDYKSNEIATVRVILKNALYSEVK